ncbi:MAG: ATP-dependent RNA helicase [Spirochaetaceae bacterium]|jgi:RNA helicase HrpA|nr:ATP-dependent RNA helicase [Spirochaetaceae bacterium]
MYYLDLPVYQHKHLILDALRDNQVIVVESPTGSGKTTQLPVILYEAGYGDHGIIGVTQPRRIAALSVSEFIARQMGTTIPGVIGYKMRFEDKTEHSTKIKIMTDGILLQEMKADSWLSKYDIIVVDEAHERSLNIDFILGLLKRVLEVRPEFKVIVSSATINAHLFSQYFRDCPIVTIDAIMFPVSMIYEAIAQSEDDDAYRSRKPSDDEQLLQKIVDLVDRIISEERGGDILIFLSGEKLIKEAMVLLDKCSCTQRLHILPLYGRLGKEEQERVFEPAPNGKVKVIISTNIAETSVTIDGVTTVIDSGQSKYNYYDPITHTSSLIEGPVSKASANQRKGRAGRTQEGACYRLYQRKDFESRPEFTLEEIYRTDISEVVLQMADLGITDFENFDFISPPDKALFVAAIETLSLLDALTPTRNLSNIGKMMSALPLSPRHSRIIVEAILKYPDVLQEAIIASAFLSTQSPYLLPLGEEGQARQAHQSFTDENGDFVSYIKLYEKYLVASNKVQFCRQYYLDSRIMTEIVNISIQLEQIVSCDLGVPVSRGGSVEHYLSVVTRALVQFVCTQDPEFRGAYRSLRANGIVIHPGSALAHISPGPRYIVAGEIVQTSRMFAMSVSPVSRRILDRIDSKLFAPLFAEESRKKKPEKLEKRENESIEICGKTFVVEVFRKKKQVLFPWHKFRLLKNDLAPFIGKWPDYRAVITHDIFRVFEGEKLDLVLALAPLLDIETLDEPGSIKETRLTVKSGMKKMVKMLPSLLTPIRMKKKNKVPSSIRLNHDKSGYWFCPSPHLEKNLKKSIASLEALRVELADPADTTDAAIKNAIEHHYNRLLELARIAAAATL